MAYADQKTSGNRIIALIIVAAIHIALGYGLVTGLAFEAAKKVVKTVTTIDIEEPEEPEEEPPPPPEKVDLPPPPVAPPPPIDLNPAPPPIQVIERPPPAPIQTVAPPPPPPPPVPPQPRGNPGSWATSNDYPSSALREDREGVTRFSVTVGTDGRVQSCQVTGSSGHSDLDEATCKYISRRARFKPATRDGSKVVGTWSSAVRWQIPD